MVSFKDIEPLQGNWSGTKAVLLNDDYILLNYTTKLVVTLLNDSLELYFTTTEFDLNEVPKEIEKGFLSIYKNGSKLSFGSREYDIQNVTRTKEELTIVAVKEDEDNDKPADIHLTIKIRAEELIILRQVKYKGTEKYLTRINMELKRK